MSHLRLGLESFGRDLRLGLRRMGRSPGFTAIALFALTLGIGAAGSMFTVVNAVLLRSIPFAEPDRLVLLSGTRREGQEVEDWPISSMDFGDWIERNQHLDPLVAFSDGFSYALTEGEAPERIVGEM